MNLETRELAAYIGKLTLGVRDLLEKTSPERFEIGRGTPEPGTYPHFMRLSEPLDCTGASLVAEELNRAFWFDPRHVHRPVPLSGDGAQIVYLAWKGKPYPGTELPKRR
jgi:hypothetical protein